MLSEACFLFLKTAELQIFFQFFKNLINANQAP